MNRHGPSGSPPRTTQGGGAALWTRYMGYDHVGIVLNPKSPLIASTWVFCALGRTRGVGESLPDEERCLDRQLRCRDDRCGSGYGVLGAYPYGGY
jgi:hypothetical protein